MLKQVLFTSSTLWCKKNNNNLDASGLFVCSFVDVFVAAVSTYQSTGVWRGANGDRVDLSLHNIYGYAYICKLGSSAAVPLRPVPVSKQFRAMSRPMKSEQFYKCLANETRLRCMMLLLAREELCVCDIAASLGVSQPMISRHLAQLRACNLVSDHREGQWVYYRFHDGLKPWQRGVLAATRDGLGTEAPYGKDLSRLQDIERRKQCGDCR